MIRPIVTFYLEAVDTINVAAKFLLGALLLWMTVATFMQVLVRFVFTNLGWAISAPWTEETARYAMIWVVFIGLGVGFRYGLLLSLTFVADALSNRIGQALRYMALALSFVFLLSIFFIGLDFLEFGRMERSPALSLPKNWIYMAMPVGAVLGCMNILALIVSAWHTGTDIRRVGTLLQQKD